MAKSKNILILILFYVKNICKSGTKDFYMKLFRLIITALTFVCCLSLVLGIPTILFAHLFGAISQVYVRTILLAALTILPILLTLFAKKENVIFNTTYVCAALMFIVGSFVPRSGFDDYSKEDGWLIGIYPPIWLFFQFFYMPIALYFRRNFLRKEKKE